jgi:hypothetical protein
MISCAAAILINLSSMPWVVLDLKMCSQASKRCTTLYGKQWHLKKFTKNNSLDYHATCGKKE